MAEISENAYDKRSDKKTCGLILYLLSEHTGKTENRKRNDIVEHYYCNSCLPGSCVRKIFQSEQLLDNRINECGAHAPTETSAVGDKNYRKHGSRRDRTSVGEINEFDHAEYGCNGDKNRTFYHTNYFFVLCHVFCTSFILKFFECNKKTEGDIGSPSAIFGFNIPYAGITHIRFKGRSSITSSQPA